LDNYHKTNFDTKVQYLKGVGPKRGKVLNSFGINTIKDLIRTFPRKYLDRTNLKPINKKELEDHAKRNLHPSPSKIANKALSIERARKREQKAEAQSKSKETGKQHDVDHVQGQANRKKNPDRWHRIHPGDSSDNRRVISQADNLKKNSKDSGEKKTTRSSAIRKALQRAQE